MNAARRLFLASGFRVAARTLALAMSLNAITACSASTDDGAPSDPITETFAPSLGVDMTQMSKKVDGVYYRDVKVGTGTEAIAGRTLTVRYTGYLTNAAVFDTNVGKPAAFSFQLGAHLVITGWDIGLGGMKTGGKRKLVIASAYGYGKQVNGSIPANSTLVFDVELLNVQ